MLCASELETAVISDHFMDTRFAAKEPINRATDIATKPRTAVISGTLEAEALIEYPGSSNSRKSFTRLRMNSARSAAMITRKMNGCILSFSAKDILEMNDTAKSSRYQIASIRALPEHILAPAFFSTCFNPI